MKITRMIMPALLALLSLPCVYAQDKQTMKAPLAQPSAEAPAAQQTFVQIPLKVQMVLTEYDGAKKISSMPYTISLMLSHNGLRESLGQLRVGVRVPIVTGKSGENGTQYTYLDIGTNIDCWVWKGSEDRYLLNGTVDLSSVYTMNSANQPTEFKPGDQISNVSNPIIRHTNGSLAIALRDGQSGEAAVATDPITGHVFKVEVTLNVVK